MTVLTAHAPPMADELSLAVVGITYPNPDETKSSRIFELKLCRPGDPVELRPEPKNEHDENAIAVFSERGIQVGYLTAERAPFILRRLHHEEAVAIFQALADDAAYVRVRFGGGVPTLPPAQEPARSASPRPSRARLTISEDGFYPDSDGPEWGA